MVREVLLGIKTLRFDLIAFQQRHGFKLQSLCRETLSALERDGFVTVSTQEIELTAKGILYGDYVGETLAASLKKLKS
jgi:oxygen-independent coproporphyrinogen-3 oxidase